MDAWDGWPFARVYLLLVAVAFLVVGTEVLLDSGIRRGTDVLAASHWAPARS